MLRFKPALTTLAEIVGLALVTRGVWLLSVPAGWITAGVCAVLCGVLLA